MDWEDRARLTHIQRGVSNLVIYDHPLLDSAYRRSPVPIQHLFVSGYGVLKRLERISSTYRRYKRELDLTEQWSAGQLLELQADRLRTLIEHAYQHVPYYRRVFKERGLTPRDIRTPADLYKLPVLTKQEVRAHRGELRSQVVPRRATTTGRTGGTTGIPLYFDLDRARVIFDHVLIHRHWSWAGYNPGDRTVLLRGFTLVDADDRSGVFWRHDWADNRIYLSGFHLSNRTMREYVDRLHKWDPRFIAAYPSSIFTLARYMESEGLSAEVEAIFTGSEAISATERTVIERVFGCRVWDRYGTGERLVVGQQCEHGCYHQNVEFGIVQVDSPRGVPVSPGVSGELIHTGLTNFSMPLIRYASDDFGHVLSGTCQCGRALPLMGPVVGRKDDVIVTRDGRLMPRAGLDQVHEFVEKMERCQLVQYQVGELTVRVLPRPGFSTSDADELTEQLRKRVGRDTHIAIELVDELPLTATGKHRFIVSHVDLNAVSGLTLNASAAGSEDPPSAH